MTGIYKITSPLGKIYIGQSRDIQLRMKVYGRASCFRQCKLYGSIVKYGWINHSIEIAHELPADVEDTILDNYEKLYWQLYLDAGREMLNIKEPGSNGRFSEETKNLISEANSKKVFQYSKDGVFINEWKSAVEAANYLKISPSPISSCVLEDGRSKTCGGFVWKRYKADKIEPPKRKKPKSSIRKRRSDLGVKRGKKLIIQQS